MDITCLNRFVCLLLDSIGPPPEADEFMAELCRDPGLASECRPRLVPEAVVDGT